MTPEQLFEEHIDFAMWAANKFHCRQDFDDIKQLAMIGLHLASLRFDVARGVQFTTYAMYYIRKEIIRNHFQKRMLIRVPRRILENAETVKRFLQETNEVHALSELSGLSVKAVEDVLEYLSYQTYSLDYEVGEDSESTIGDLMPGQVEDWDELIHIKDFMEMLDEREKLIINMRLNGCPQTEIGEALNVSQMHASRLLKKLKVKFKEYVA